MIHFVKEVISLSTCRKEKLNTAKQIEHMKNKGIQFTIEDEAYAENYLTNNTYYFKLKAYEKLYNKSPSGENKDKYINLEFAYLRDLATIDSLLRKKILSIAIDIEHYLKVKLLNDFNISPEDGYEIIEVLKSSNPEHFENEINTKLNGRTCSDLVLKYKDCFAIWNFVEIISFKDFCDLYALFYSRNAEQFCKRKNKENFKGEFYYFMNPVRLLRNAAAHNNCLLIGLNKSPDTTFNFEYKVSSFLGTTGIKNTSLNRQLSKPIIHDFCVLLFLSSKVAPPKAQYYTFIELKKLFEERIFKHKEYYNNNALIASAFQFMYSVVEVFYGISQKNISNKENEKLPLDKS